MTNVLFRIWAFKVLLGNGKRPLRHKNYHICQNFLLTFNWVFKVHIFWEGHKIFRNLHLPFDWHYIGHKISQIFVALSEYMNFMNKEMASYFLNQKLATLDTVKYESTWIVFHSRLWILNKWQMNMKSLEKQTELL